MNLSAECPSCGSTSIAASVPPAGHNFVFVQIQWYFSSHNERSKLIPCPELRETAARARCQRRL